MTNGLGGPQRLPLTRCLSAGPELCFWISLVSYLTSLLTAGQVFATALNNYVMCILPADNRVDDTDD